jgi:TonB family protein
VFGLRGLVAMMGALVSSAAAQPPPPAQGNPGSSGPVLIERHEAQYSEEARTARLVGSVQLAFVVDEGGMPRDLRVLRALGLGLDEEALKAVQTWRFRPAMKDGTPAAVASTAQVNFRVLDDPSNPWHLERAGLDMPAGASRPRLINSPFPKDAPAENTSILLLFDINENGAPVNLAIANPKNSSAEAAVMDAVKLWRFTPARQDGYALPTHASFTFVSNLGAASVSTAPLRPALPASAPSRPSGPVRPGAGVTQPLLLSKVEPSYSEEARKARLQGRVQLQAVVNTNGMAVDFTVKTSLGLGLDEEAVRAVKQWRFSPGAKDGVVVPVIVTIDVNFRLLENDKLPWRLTRAMFDSPEGASRPVLAKCEYPHKAPKEHATVALSFDIDEHGEPKNLNVDKSVDSEPEQEIIAAVKKWRFKPAAKDGAPIPARATFEFIGRPGS